MLVPYGLFQPGTPCRIHVPDEQSKYDGGLGVDGVGSGGPASGISGVSGEPSTQSPVEQSPDGVDGADVGDDGGAVMIVELIVTHPHGGHPGCVIGESHVTDGKPVGQWSIVVCGVVVLGCGVDGGRGVVHDVEPG